MLDLSPSERQGKHSMERRNWTREELIVVFNLYCRIPFGRIHNRNPEVIALAFALGRTASAVSYKLANFASLDPAILGRNLSGASHGSRLDKEVWDQFNNNWDLLAFESEQLRSRLLNMAADLTPQEEFPEGKTRAANVMIRVNQSFFRAAVIAAYDGQCCVTGIAVPELLSASHIVPWSVDMPNRTNPRNGLSLNALHDRAFDRGLFTFDENLQLRISTQIAKLSGEAMTRHIFHYEGAQLRAPSHFLPDPTFLAYHRRNIFQG
jgi:putative restriction endonuclease